jgi:hypothetical protein
MTLNFFENFDLSYDILPCNKFKRQKINKNFQEISRSFRRIFYYSVRLTMPAHRNFKFSYLVLYLKSY